MHFLQSSAIRHRVQPDGCILFAGQPQIGRHVLKILITEVIILIQSESAKGYNRVVRIKPGRNKSFFFQSGFSAQVKAYLAVAIGYMNQSVYLIFPDMAIQNAVISLSPTGPVQFYLPFQL